MVERAWGGPQQMATFMLGWALRVALQWIVIGPIAEWIGDGR